MHFKDSHKWLLFAIFPLIITSIIFWNHGIDLQQHDYYLVISSRKVLLGLAFFLGFLWFIYDRYLATRGAQVLQVAHILLTLFSLLALLILDYWSPNAVESIYDWKSYALVVHRFWIIRLNLAGAFLFAQLFFVINLMRTLWRSYKSTS